MKAEDLQLLDEGLVHWKFANWLRSMVERGSKQLSPENRSLLTGLVYGDDRGQPASLENDFRNSGLSHLLAVSGENVAFVFALATPLRRRFGLNARLIIGVAVLVLFGAMTRWEPSVMRAEAMFGMMLIAERCGRPISTIRALSLAVVASLMADPFLVGVPGFLLSVSACLGLIVLSKPLARRLPGPKRVAQVIAMSAAAQLGALPVLIAIGGDVAPAGILANALADPVAGFVMAWGLVGGVLAGVLAGVFGDGSASFIHLPTQLLLWWIRLVAGITADISWRGMALISMCVSLPWAWWAVVPATVAMWQRARTRFI